MPATRLTDRKIASLRAPRVGRKEYPDATLPGLAFRITNQGARSWSLRTRVNGEQLRLTLGAYPLIGLAAAREKARDALKLADKGEDPRVTAATVAAADAKRKADTIAHIAEMFIAKHASQRRWGELERVLRVDVVPVWGARPVAEITRRDVIELLDGIVDRGAVVQANRTLTVLKIFFGWWVSRDDTAVDPTARVKKPIKETPRDRALTDDELRAFWKGCGDLGWPFGPLLRLLALTASRKGEIGELVGSEIDEKERRMELAGSRYKTGRAHTVPLSAPAIAILEELPRIGESEFLFTTNSKTPVSGFSKAKTQLDAAMLGHLQQEARERGDDAGKVTLPEWRIHDLRRTVRTRLAQLGVNPDIAERVLGHVIPGIRGVYDRHEYLAEKRQALETWAAALARIVDPPPAGKVVAIRKMAASQH